MNKCASEFAGISYEEAVQRTGGSISTFKGTDFGDFYYPEDVEETAKALQNAFETKTKFSYEVRHRRADGQYRWLLVSGSPILTEDGEFLGFVGTSIDTHDRVMAEKSLAQYAKRLKQSNQELEQFAFIASHDLQEPLRKVLIFSEHLKSIAEGLANEEALDDLTRIRKSVQRMQCLIDDLLNLSRVTRRGKPFQQIDLATVIREVLADLSYLSKGLGARITVDKMPELEADPQQMHQLFFQLLENAIKFHRPGVPPEIRIAFKPLPDEQACRITVADNGMGIKPEYSDKIFSAFARLHHEKDIEGTGIGLALAQKIVERHQGSIRVESRLGEGSVFTVTLPLVQAPETA
jgi:PAS domain S-box-containing protein